jgi:putative proteasome-type protease
MTFCIAMKIEEGLVGIADTRITTGNECITARKVTVHHYGHHAMFLMTSGLRSLRDKALTYFEEVLDETDTGFNKLYKAVNAFALQLRRVAQEDREALEESGLPFNLFTIIGGQLEDDREHKLFLLYPQATWVEVGQGTPYFVIGESSYGKPLLDRALTYSTRMEKSLKIGVLAFDSTRRSASDVDFPVDVLLYRRDSHQFVEHRYERNDLQHISEWWQNRLRSSIDELPSEWVEDSLSKMALQLR